MTAADTPARTPGGRRLTPLLVDLGGWKALVVGGGPIGARRAATLVESGADVHVVSPEVAGPIVDLAREGELTVAARPFEPSDLVDADIVVAATGDAEVDIEVRRLSAEAGVLCNVAADAESCDVVFPSSVQRGPLMVAVSTGGASPALAARARDLIENAIGPEWGELAELLEASRGRLRSAFPDAADRRAAVDGLLESGVLDLLAHGQRDEADRLIDDALGSG
jgi:siroheme synthase-like protein